MEVGIKIKMYLDKTGISQTYVSKKTGIPLSKLKRSLNGKRRLTFEEYTMICEILGVDTIFFLKPRLPSGIIQGGKEIV